MISFVFYEFCGGKMMFVTNFSVLIIMQIMVTKKCMSVWRKHLKNLNFHGLTSHLSCAL